MSDLKGFLKENERGLISLAIFVVLCIILYIVANQVLEAVNEYENIENVENILTYVNGVAS